MGPIFWQFTGLHGRINSHKVHPIVQVTFPKGNAVFQVDNVPIHTAINVKEWHEEHFDEVEHLVWPPQTPDLNIIKHLCFFLEL